MDFAGTVLESTGRTIHGDKRMQFDQRDNAALWRGYECKAY